MQRLCCKTTTQIILLPFPYYVILHAQTVPMEFVYVSSFKVTNVNEGKYLYFRSIYISLVENIKSYLWPEQ